MKPPARSYGPVVLLTVAALVIVGCTSDGPAAGRASTAEELQGLPDLTDCPEPSGVPAAGESTLPDLTLPCLDSSGGELVVGQAPGRPLVVNLWASWCGPCREELPDFQKLYETTDPDQLLVLGIVTRDSPGLAAEFAQDLGVDFPSGWDENGDVYIAEGLRGLPATFFVNADGSVAHAELAPIASYDDLVVLVDRHLGVVVG